MSASNFDRPGRLLATAILGLLLAGCGSGGGDGGPDTRCFGVAQVVGWQVHVTGAFGDQGVADSLTLSLHATFDGTGVAGPVQPSITSKNGFGWYAGKPTGTFAAADTQISTTSDTIIGAAAAFGAGPAKNYGPYVSVNLATCQASVGAILYSVVTRTDSKAGTSVLDTIFAAYPYYSGLTIDSLAVADGWTVPSAKVRSVLQSASFGTGGEYRVGGLSDPYLAAGTTLDSATVSFTVTPVTTLAAPGTAAPEGATMLPSGVLVPPKR